jgi:broad specificity phosphatase PhoE
VNAPAGPPDGVRIVRDGKGQPTRLVLIRHGESQCSQSGVIGGPKGCTGLTARGIFEAEALRDRLLRTGELEGATALYSSVLARAVQTAQIASPGIGRGLDLVTDCGVCELHPGDADGLTWDEFVAKYGAPDFDAQPDLPLCPNGESWTEFVERASESLRTIAQNHPGQLVVVVCHAGVVEASLIAFLPVAPWRGRLKLRTEHTSLTEWELQEGGWQLLRYNDAAHLFGVLRDQVPSSRSRPSN